MGGEYIGFSKVKGQSIEELRKKAIDFLDKAKAPKPTQMKEGGEVIDRGGNYHFENQFGSYTWVKIMPVDENLKLSPDYFSVQVTVNAKNEDGTQRVQPKPLKTYPISKYNDFIEDLINRGATKVEK